MTDLESGFEDFEQGNNICFRKITWAAMCGIDRGDTIGGRMQGRFKRLLP